MSKKEFESIDQRRYAGFESMMNNKKKIWPYEIMSKLLINEDTYNLFLRYYFTKKDEIANRKKSSGRKTKIVEEFKRQNIQDGYLPWVNDIFRRCNYVRL